MREKSTKRKSKSDWKRVDAMSDDEIDYSEIPELDEEWFENAFWGIPAKKIVTIRLDFDVVDWFRNQGPGYQTRINALLKAYVDVQKRRVSQKASVKARVSKAKTKKRA